MENTKDSRKYASWRMVGDFVEWNSRIKEVYYLIFEIDL